MVVQLYGVLLDAHPTHAGPSADLSGYVWGFGYGTFQVNEGLRLIVSLVRSLYPHLLY